MDLMRSMHELVEKMDNKADIRASMREVNKLPHKDADGESPPSPTRILLSSFNNG